MSDPVDGLVGDARVVVERDAAAIPRDFAAVLARAGVEQAATDSGNVLAMPSRTREVETSGDRVLDGLVGDARESIDRMVAQRRMRPIPELAIARPIPRRRGAIIAGVALLAAAVVLVLGGLRWVERGTQDDVDASREQAFSSQVEGGPDGVAHEVEPPVRPRAPTIAPPTPVPAPAPVIATPNAEPPRNAVRPSVDQLRALAEDAHRRWRAGDRAGAEAKFERIVKLGGRSSAAELAYGDLFALARQLHDTAKQRARWRAYVKRFPKGRFADDARAGLCRAGGDASCWRDYLRDFPRGSYRSEAASAVGQGDP
ncbi:MAG TPA: hypothetical protein VG755_16865 [Nannocystaceae bacterium]|nr:hypothetical protein [Nannocystaceae bacterium]